ncbi:DivIVA domain-containing protein [Anaerotruncus colihominis]|uniref:DivIVA domain-containing protein n=1 Tax=Anaerotruncus colihominis TaxID=169435 RepID=A0A845SNG2_9FIRM|nr:DivIVA domain-containing protein [Anaerotruncus colihominis]NDO38539.1 DivIVA domain-containing protein [Anaerotruncus colihominis]
MLNPNEIANKRFDKVMGQKYRADEVDNYLAQVADSMNDLLEEKQELEKKLIVLADKLEEYKDDEESLRSALLGAQKLGDSVVRDAKAKARDILEDAEARANMIVEDAKMEIERQQAGFVRMQREVATFKSKLQLAYKQHLELIASIPVDENVVNPAMKKTQPKPPEAPAESDEPSESVPEQTEMEDAGDFPADSPENPDGLADLPAQEDGYPPAEDELPPLTYSEEDSFQYEETDEYIPDGEPEEPARRESRFGPLKFGREFDLKRNDGKRRR